MLFYMLQDPLQRPQHFHPSGPFVWAKGAGLSISPGRTEFLFNLLPFLAVMQEMISATIVALHMSLSSPLGLLCP